MLQPIIWVGLDVHKDSITAAILEGDAPEAEVFRLSSDLMKVRRMFRRISKRGAVQACYEASGSGYVLQRTLERDGFFCEVVAPSLIPRKPGERVKTDRRDARKLVELNRAGRPEHARSCPYPASTDPGPACARRSLRPAPRHRSHP